MNGQRTHILKPNEEFTFCALRGKGPHSTVYAMRFEDADEVRIVRPYVCKRCARSYRKMIADGAR